MTKILLLIVLIFLTFVTTIASQWYVYGLWPQNWGAVIGFWITGLTLGALIKVVEYFD